MAARYTDDRDRDFRSNEPRRRERDRDHPRERVVEPPRDRDRDRERERDRDRDRERDRRPIDDRVPEREPRRGDTQMTDAMDIVERRIPVEARMDPRLDPRIDRMDIGRDTTRANTARSIDPVRPDRMVDNRSAEPQEKYLTDPTTGQLYRQVPPPSRQAGGYPRDDRDYVDPPPSRSRTTMDTPMRDEPRANLSEYWCPGEGIEREVLQHEICKFLGQDATSRPGTDNRGRPGFWVKAYRPFTTAMEQTLRDESDRWLREKERRRRHGEPRGSYEQLAEQMERRRYPGDMDLDDDSYQRPPAVRHRDPRDPRDRDMEPSRPVTTGRIPVTTAYPPEPGFPASYAISSSQTSFPPGQPPYYGTEREPRTFNSGNTTPPSAISRASQSAGYGQPGYSSRSAPPVSQPIAAPYDSRGRDIMSGAYSSGYPESRSRR